MNGGMSPSDTNIVIQRCNVAGANSAHRLLRTLAQKEKEDSTSSTDLGFLPTREFRAYRHLHCRSVMTMGLNDLLRADCMAGLN